MRVEIIISFCKSYIYRRTKMADQLNFVSSLDFDLGGCLGFHKSSVIISHYITRSNRSLRPSWTTPCSTTSLQMPPPPHLTRWGEHAHNMHAHTYMHAHACKSTKHPYPRHIHAFSHWIRNAYPRHIHALAPRALGWLHACIMQTGVLQLLQKGAGSVCLKSCSIWYCTSCFCAAWGPSDCASSGNHWTATWELQKKLQEGEVLLPSEIVQALYLPLVRWSAWMFCK
jgi:hypothetical protein